jgi:Zn-dependent M28 family amino/carboxypeptidase
MMIFKFKRIYKMANTTRPPLTMLASRPVGRGGEKIRSFPLTRGGKKSKQIVIIAIIAILFSSFAYAEKNDVWYDIIGSAYLDNAGYKVLERICDEAGGRHAGTQNNEKAMNILIEELKKAGCTPIVERFEFDGWMRNEDKVEMLEPSNQQLRAVALAFVDSAPPFIADAIFIEHGFPEDFENAEVKGKIAIVTEEHPKGKERLLRLEIIESAAANGAAAVLFVMDKEGGIVQDGVSNFHGKPSLVPAFSVSMEDGRRIMRLLDRNIPVKLKIDANSYCRKQETGNIIVRFTGNSDKKIVVGAHFDSWDLGTGGVDNGHGTAILFDIARLLKKYSPNNEYSIDLVWFNGEELGLLGSKKYVEMHAEEEILAMINMDMTGSPTGFNAMGYDEFIPFFEDLAVEFEGFNMKNGVTSKPWTNSDHMYFMFAGIPSFTLHAHLDKPMYWYYHDYNDTFDKVNIRYLSDAAAMITVLTYELANGTELPYKRYSKQETMQLLIDNNLDERLKRQNEWIFDK